VSIHLSYLSTAAETCGEFLWARRQEISIDYCTTGPVPRNIIAGLKIAPRRTLRRNKFAGGEHIPGENPPVGENCVTPPLK